MNNELEWLNIYHNHNSYIKYEETNTLVILTGAKYNSRTYNKHD